MHKKSRLFYKNAKKIRKTAVYSEYYLKINAFYDNIFIKRSDIYMITIDNCILRLAVDEHGAQMRSLFDIENGKEYLWQADPDIWGRTAPILFPAVGKMQTDGYDYNGKRYSMSKHGFLRDSEFCIEEKTENSLVLVMRPDEKIKANYPFDFAFRAKYELEGRKLHFSYEIENCGNEDMYFSIGAHPGFNCEHGDKIIFNDDENITALYFNEADRPNDNALPVVMNSSRELTITEDFFNDGSLCFPAISSDGVSLVRDGKTYLKMTFGKIPHLWLWAKPGAKFICIEPWHGSDECIFETDITKKDGIIALAPKKTFVFHITVEI